MNPQATAITVALLGILTSKHLTFALSVEKNLKQMNLFGTIIFN